MNGGNQGARSSRIRRNFTSKGPDAWSMLFPDTVRNSNTGDHEKSFDYVLRHTQYRIRDLLRLTRECVEHEAVNREISVDDVLGGRQGQRISERNIRAAIVKACKGTATDRILEGNRRFPGLAEDAELLRGIAVPFKIGEVKKRMERRSDGARREIVGVLNNLWNSSIIGLQINGRSVDSVKQLKASLDTGTLSQIDKDQKNAVFYVFDYATDKNILDIVNTFDGEDGKSEHNDIDVNLVLHPMLFEYLDARVNEKHPIGI